MSLNGNQNAFCLIDSEIKKHNSWPEKIKKMCIYSFIYENVNFVFLVKILKILTQPLKSTSSLAGEWQLALKAKSAIATSYCSMYRRYKWSYTVSKDTYLLYLFHNSINHTGLDSEHWFKNLPSVESRQLVPTCLFCCRYNPSELLFTLTLQCLHLG